MARDRGKPSKQDKGKGIASGSQEERDAEIAAEIDREIDEGLQAETETEADIPPPKETVATRRVENIPSYTKLLAHMKTIELASMRFPDISTLQDLGILEDVRMLLRNMGLESFLGMTYPVHKEVSYQFLASLEAVFHDEYDEQEGYGHITFKIRGKSHKMGFKRLSSIFGLSDAAESRLPQSSLISNDVWTWIASGPRDPGGDRCNDIHSPGVRYAAKVLSHTLYCRREPGAVNESELKFLALALLPMDEFGKLQNTDPDDFKDLGLIGILVRRFIYYKYWAWTHEDGTPQLLIGNLITPILAALNINLGPVWKEARYIDLPYLKRTKFLGGKAGERSAYRYRSGYNQDGYSFILLPNQALTSLPAHIAFDPARCHLVPGDNPEFDPIKAPRKRKKRAEAESSSTARPSDADDEGPVTPTQMYGTERYYFQPFTGVTSSVGLRESLAQNAKLQRWNKMQDRTIHKLKESVKVLKRQMRKVTSLLAQTTIGSGCQRDDVMTEAGSSALPRPSFYEPSAPARSPDFVLRRQRRNQPPPPRDSSNESPSVATADDWDTEDTAFYP